MTQWRICPSCLKAHKRSFRKENNGRKAHKPWPAFVYHDGHTRRCIKHTLRQAQSQVKRRAVERSAAPIWADRQKIKEVYTDAYKRRSNGEAVEVDHIVPLRGRTVCGLHVHNNLRIISKRENSLKSNSLDHSLVDG